jgi:tRNA(Ile)-lysidine synthase
MPPLIERFERHLAETRLLSRDRRALVGYSGGADSTCLLHMLAKLGYDLVAAHLHHGQRSEADAELAECEKFCDEIGVPFLSGRADVPRMAEDLGIGLEEAGRRARYSFFDQGAFRTECQAIATAHTRSDLVETVLLNLARGTGMQGLGGVPERRGMIVRPMLIFDRAETRAYCVEHGLWFHDDPSNSDLSLSRARIRHNIIPELSHVNAAAEGNIARLAEIVREEDSFLDGMAASGLEQSEAPLNGELAFLTEDVEVAFHTDRLTSLPAPLLKRAVRLAFEALGSILDHNQTVRVVQGLATMPNGSITSEGGSTVLEWNPSTVHVRDLTPTTPYRHPLTVPGETISDEFGWQFVAYSEFGSEAPIRRSLEARLDANKVKGSLYFRTAKEGDEMQPLGFEGHRKVSDLMSEARLTIAARQRLPVVCDMLGPLWAPGVCLSGRAAATVQTTRTIVVRFESLRQERRS